jgi:hypothetical protein
MSRTFGMNLEKRVLSDLLVMRWVVGLLGSKSHNNWWGCDFLSEHGLAACEYNFPSSTFGSALTSTTAAARLHHDERIGRNHVWHLFRVPFPMERALHNDLLSKVTFDDDPMSVLARLAEGEIDAPDGPVQVGGSNDIPTPSGVSEIARHYHAAFRSGRVILPYFAAPSR